MSRPAAVRRARRRVIVVTGACAGVLALSACGSGSGSSNSPGASPSAPAGTATASSSAASSPPLESASTGATAAVSTGTTAAASTGAAAPSTAGGRPYTMAQIATHKSAKSCWTVIDGVVYDVTKWVSRHPGGQGPILGMCGVDASKAYAGQHGSEPDLGALLASFRIGSLAG